MQQNCFHILFLQTNVVVVEVADEIQTWTGLMIMSQSVTLSMYINLIFQKTIFEMVVLLLSCVICFVIFEQVYLFSLYLETAV